MACLRKTVAYSVLFLVATACAQAPVYTQVDSVGDAPPSKNSPLFFITYQHEVENSLTLKECKRAATDLGLNVSEQKCSHCSEVDLKSKVIAGETTWTGSPNLLNGGGVFGDERSVNSGLASRESVKSKTQNSRELSLTVYPDVDRIKPLREISVKSVGNEANVSAVAYELCKAAFADYPENLQNKQYDIKR